ncbi:MAG: hypothetical protein J6O73_09335, partial [Lachnospiraceae bacterium]|nr:hypothetical protein [Lachnospiraceae bacterium]
MKKKWRQLMGILLSLALILGLMPGMSLTAYAATETYTNLMNNKTVVKFNNHDWYIIADDSTTMGGTVTLLAADTSFGTSAFDSTSPFSNAYSNSTVKGVLDALTAEGGAFASVKDAIADTDLSDVGVTGAKLYLLSTSEAGQHKCPFGEEYFDHWWLRSPGRNYNEAAFVDLDNVDANSDPVWTVDYGVRPALKLNLPSVIFSSETNTFTVLHSVTITPGSNMTKTTDSGAATQTGVTGAMTDVVYTADEGYKFPETSEAYTTKNGITVARTSDTVITVSGTPTADVEITIPDADIDTMSGDAYAAYNVTTDDNKTKSGDALTALQVTFHGMPWYIISDNSTAVDAGTVTLLAADTGFGLSKFDSTDPYSN